jgi:NAD(P)H-hydrate epimerase
MSEPTITVDELAELLRQTGGHHHQAFLESDGADPEWALWYAAYLQAHLWDRGGSLPSRSQLVHLLMSVAEEHAASGPNTPWPEAYAASLLDKLATD